MLARSARSQYAVRVWDARSLRSLAICRAGASSRPHGACVPLGALPCAPSGGVVRSGGRPSPSPAVGGVCAVSRAPVGLHARWGLCCGGVLFRLRGLFLLVPALFPCLGLPCPARAGCVIGRAGRYAFLLRHFTRSFAARRSRLAVPLSRGAGSALPPAPLPSARSNHSRAMRYADTTAAHSHHKPHHHTQPFNARR